MIEKDALIALLDKGYTNEQLSTHFNCGISTVKRYKSKYSLVGYKTNSKPLSPKQIQLITALCDKQYSLKEIEESTNISAHTIHKYVSKELYSRILLNGKEKWVSNLIKADISPIFEPSTKSAYICGVLQSDGFLTSDGYIGITAKDKDFVKDFAKFFNTGIRVIEKNGITYFGCRFKDVRNLEKFTRITNILPNKTYSEYKIPKWILSSEDKLREFIVGVFNGDGWVHKPSDRNTCEIGIEQHIANKGMLLELNKYLDWNVYQQNYRFRISTKTYSTVDSFYTWFSASDNALLRKVAVLDSIFYKI